VTRYVLIGVEGNHDQAFVSKVLYSLLGYAKFDGKESELNPLWRKFIPQYPPKNGRLYQRLDMPTILFKNDLSLAIYAGEGSKLISNLNTKLSDIDTSELFAFAIIADADKKTPMEIAREYHDGFRETFPNFPTIVKESGNVIEGSPKLGLYILPDNSNQGVLDSLLCDCGDIVYPEYMRKARHYIEQFSEEERKEKPLKWKPFDREKAIVATVTSVLKPGKTNQVTISDNDWISSITEQSIPELRNFTTFLRNLLDLNHEVNNSQEN